MRIKFFNLYNIYMNVIGVYNPYGLVQKAGKSRKKLKQKNLHKQRKSLKKNKNSRRYNRLKKNYRSYNRFYR